MAQQSGGPNIRALISLALAGVGVLVAGVVIVQLYGNYQAQMSKVSQTEQEVQYLMAKTDLSLGVPITAKDIDSLVDLVSVEPRYIDRINGLGEGPERILTKDDLEWLIGRAPRERILSREFIRADRIADATMGTGLNAVIDKDKRAFSVEVSGGRAVSGFLKPGDLVDVMVTYFPQNGAKAGQQPETHYLQQAIKVLGVGGDAGMVVNWSDLTEVERNELLTERAKARTVTLSVSPDDAEKLAHAQALGEITLVMRNQQDNAPDGSLQGVAVDDLFSNQPRTRNFDASGRFSGKVLE